MMRRFLMSVVSLGCGCNSLYVRGQDDGDGGGAGTSTGTEVSTGVFVPTTASTEATTEDSTTWAGTSTSSDGGTSTSTGEAIPSTSTSDSSSESDPETTGGEAPVRRVFLTSVRYNGALLPQGLPVFYPVHGLDLADSHCQSLAEGVGLTGTFKAWLSSTVQDGGSRTKGDESLADLPLARMDGTRVASNWADFTSGTLMADMALTEEKQVPEAEDYLFWSATKADGTLVQSKPNCEDWLWMSWPVPSEGRVGNAEKTDDRWSNDQTAGCDELHRLLCIQTSLQ